MFTPHEASVGLFWAVVMVAGIIAGAYWVYTDARAQLASGHSIVYSWGTVRISTPAGWFVACALVFELFIPAYLSTRRHA
jgi:hypothetical protein